MSDSSAGDVVAQGVPCNQIEPKVLENEEIVLSKTDDADEHSIFMAWLRNEARKRCEGAYCTSGHCHGHPEVKSFEVLSSDDNEFRARFSAELICRCE